MCRQSLSAARVAMILFMWMGQCESACDDDSWTEYNLQCYKVFDTLLPYDGAVQACSDLGYEMPTLDAQGYAGELSMLETLASENNIESIWLGYTDRTTESTFVDSDGGSLPIAADSALWFTGQPDDHDGQDCLGFLYALDHTAWKLFDFSCDSQLAYVCRTPVVCKPSDNTFKIQDGSPSVADGDMTTLTCSTGYFGCDVFTTCQSSGFFVEAPLCTIMTCTVLPVQNGEPTLHEVLSKVNFGEKVQYKCHTGYKPVGETNVECTGEPMIPPDCVQVTCKVSLSGPRTLISPQDTSDVRYGDLVWYRCSRNGNMLPTGENSISCKQNGKLEDPIDCTLMCDDHTLYCFLEEATQASVYLRNMLPDKTDPKFKMTKQVVSKLREILPAVPKDQKSENRAYIRTRLYEIHDKYPDQLDVTSYITWKKLMQVIGKIKNELSGTITTELGEVVNQIKAVWDMQYERIKI